MVSDAKVRLRLAEEDARAIEMGSREVVHENVSPSMLIYQGLEFEDLQYVFLSEIYDCMST